jgi:hypothetical protein
MAAAFVRPCGRLPDYGPKWRVLPSCGTAQKSACALSPGRATEPLPLLTTPAMRRPHSGLTEFIPAVPRSCHGRGPARSCGRMTRRSGSISPPGSDSNSRRQRRRSFKADGLALPSYPPARQPCWRPHECRRCDFRCPTFFPSVLSVSSCCSFCRADATTESHRPRTRPSPPLAPCFRL